MDPTNYILTRIIKRLNEDRVHLANITGNSKQYIATTHAVIDIRKLQQKQFINH